MRDTCMMGRTVFAPWTAALYGMCRTILETCISGTSMRAGEVMCARRRRVVRCWCATIIRRGLSAASSLLRAVGMLLIVVCVGWRRRHGGGVLWRSRAPVIGGCGHIVPLVSMWRIAGKCASTSGNPAARVFCGRRPQAIVTAYAGVRGRLPVLPAHARVRAHPRRPG